MHISGFLKNVSLVKSKNANIFTAALMYVPDPTGPPVFHPPALLPIFNAHQGHIKYIVNTFITSYE